MASTVQVVLKDDVEKLGSIGDVVRVRRGFARNYLIPRGHAVMATRGNLKQIEHEKAVQARRVDKLKSEQQRIIDEIQKVALSIAKEAGEDGKLFGSVTAVEVAELLEAKGVQVDRKKLVMPDKPIKVVGSYEVGVKFPYGLSATLKLDVKTRA